MGTELKLCKDCKWCKRTFSGLFQYQFSQCHAPQNRVIDLVTGRYVLNYEYCSTNRKGENNCGQQAIWWERKPFHYG